MGLNNKKQQQVLIKNISNLCLTTKKLNLYCSFVSKNKMLDTEYVKSQIENIKFHLQSIENNFN